MNANNKLKITKKNIIISFKPYTEKINKKKIEIWSDPDPEPDPDPDPEPDPHQNDTDPKHCFKLYNKLFVLFFLYVQI